VTTDICVYKLQDGRFGEQYGKNSMQQKVQSKPRHVPPFPFLNVARLCSHSGESSELLTLLDGSGQSIEFYSLKSKKQILRIDKKGDYGIRCFDQACLDDNTVIVAYSDGQDTQIFKYIQSELTLTKLTKPICHLNEINKLPVFTWL
jgi:hypothetical protein